MVKALSFFLLMVLSSMVSGAEKLMSLLQNKPNRNLVNTSRRAHSHPLSLLHLTHTSIYSIYIYTHTCISKAAVIARSFHLYVRAYSACVRFHRLVHICTRAPAALPFVQHYVVSGYSQWNRIEYYSPKRITRAGCRLPLQRTERLCRGRWAEDVYSRGPSPAKSWCSWQRRCAPVLKYTLVKQHVESLTECFGITCTR